MSGYIGTQPVPQATQHRETFTATASQTSFATAGYTPQFLDVFLNGIHLLNPDDYTASNGSDVVLTTGAALDDVLEVISYSPFEVANQTFTGTTTVDVLTATGAMTGTDLTLSGGVYLGGTGSANYLQDYETGTWTPVFSDADSGGNTATGIIRGLYTKIGNQVTVNCSSLNLVTTGMTGANDLRIQGLPFTPTNYTSPNQFWMGGTRLGTVVFSTSGFVSAYVTDNATYVRLGESISGVILDNIICSQLTSGASDVDFTITYHTDS